MKLYKDGCEPKEYKEKAFQNEKTAFKELSFKKKLEYIWDYYKIMIITICGVILLAIVVVPQIIENMKPTKLYVTMINTEWTDDDMEPLFEEFSNEYDIDREEYKLVSDTSTIINHNKPDQNSVDSAQKIAALIGNKTMDVFVSDLVTHDTYSDKGSFYDLRKILDEEFIEQYKDILYYTEIENEDGTKESIPYGIYINSLETFSDAYTVDAVAGIILNTENLESAKNFIYMVFDYNQ